MGSDRRWWWLALIVLIIGIPLYIYWKRPPQPGTPQPGPGVGSSVTPTQLTMDTEGGFAYVHLPATKTLNIAYLKSTNVADCVVKQLGVRLSVAGGTLIEPATMPFEGFDVAGATITFPALSASAEPLVVNRGPRPAAPGLPANPGVDADWADLKWVASLHDAHSAHLKSTWQDEIDGRVEIQHGRLVGAHPSDAVAQKGVWEFKGGAGAPAPFKQAMTDVTRYTVSVPADRVVIKLEHATSGLAQIVVKADASHAVKLKLIGVHEDAPATIPIGTQIHHYCAFYQLLDTPVASSARLLPHWAGDPTVATGVGQGSPGGLCPGDFISP